MKRLIILISIFSFIHLADINAQVTDQEPINLGDPEEISYLEPKDYEIGGVRVTGAEYLDTDVLITISKLVVGQYITVPSEETASVIKVLMDQNLFENVQLYADKLTEDQVFFDIRVTERPRLSYIEINGLKKSLKEDIQKKIGGNSGRIVNENLIKTTRNTIENELRKKSFLYPDITIKTVKDSSELNNEILIAEVERNNKIKVQKVNFTGNEVFSSGKLTKWLKGVKPKKWWRIFGPGKYKDEKYDEAKEKLIATLHSKGYRDAEIIKDTIKRYNQKRIEIDIDLYEGPQYYVGDISWTGNSKYSDSVLNIILGIEKGDIFNEEKLNTKLQGPTRNGDDLGALYQNDGYLTFSVNPVIKKIYNDTIDLEVQVYEGKQYTINRVLVKGNDITNDRVVLRSIYTKPGQKYSRELIMRSIREISQLGMFDEESILPDIPQSTMDHEEGTTDIVFNVKEKPSDQVELSGGYGAGQVIGTLGLTFNNFSTSNFFKKDAWKPLPRGDGQKLSIRGQTSGKRYQSYSFSFMEPWLGGKKPVNFGISAYTSNSSYGGFDYWTGRQMVTDDKLNRIWMTGVTVSLGKRLQWPDNYFQINSALSFQRYKLQNYANYFMFDNGTAYNVNFTQEISRNSVDAPIYPTSGSHIRLSIQLTPPYSSWNNLNYETAPDEEKFKWTEYHKWKFDSQWYAKIAGKLVLKTQAQFGYLGNYTNRTPTSTFERFKLGGDGMQGFDFLQGSEIIAMRGYMNGTVIPESTGDKEQNIAIYSGSPIYTKYQLELRHPVMLNEQATVFVMAFAEAGNTWNKFNEVNPFKLRRSAGVGARIFLPIFGMLGIDYGHAFDPIPGLPESQWKQNFTFSILQNMGGF